MNNILFYLRKYCKERRSGIFFSYIENLPRPIKILDLGGTAKFWQSWGIKETDKINITLINNHHIDKTNDGYDNQISFIQEIKKDVNELNEKDFEDYNLIFSNSLIEHLESFEKQLRLGKIIQKSQKPYFIQTPNKNFIVDPHFPHPCVPFFAIYPKNLKAWLLTINAFGSGQKSSSIDQAKKRFLFYNPLSSKEFKKIFSSGKLKREGRIFSTSLIMVNENVK